VFDLTAGQLIRIAVGVAVFAVLMSFRHEAEAMWVRALVAGFAAAVLAWSLVSSFAQTKKK
jgi:hypothetical protein